MRILTRILLLNSLLHYREEKERRRRRRKHGGGAAAAAAAASPYYCSDAFNRSDRALSGDTPDVGTAWEEFTGAWQITTNQAGETTGAVFCFLVSDNSQTDGTHQVTAAAIGSSGCGIAMRLTDASNVVFMRLTSGLLSITRRTAAVNNLIGSAGVTSANGDVIKCVISGNTYDCYHNGTLKFSVSEAQGAANTKHGLEASSTNTKHDDYTYGP